MNGDERDRRRRQVERLLAYPQVGTLAGPAIASNLGISPEALQPILDGLVEDGRLVRGSDGRYAVRAGRGAVATRRSGR